MKKLLKIILIVLVLLSIAALAAPFFISADTFKQPLIAKIEAATGHKISIDGPMALTFFPTASVSMEKVSISNPQNFPGSEPFITLDSLKVRVSTLPLLTGRIFVHELALGKPHIRLRVTGDGGNNWSFTPAPKSAQEQPSKPQGKAASPVSEILVSGFTVTDGSVDYTNAATGGKWTVTALDSSVSLRGLTSPFTAKGSGIWNGKKITADAKFDSLQTLLDNKRTKTEATVTSDLLTLETNGAIDKGAFYTGKLHATSPSLKALSAWATPGSKPSNTPAVLALELNGDAECSNVYCSFKNLDLTLDALKAKGSMRIDYGAARPKFALALSTNTLDFNAFLPQQQAENGVLIRPAYAAEWDNQPMDFSGLRGMDGTADIRAEGVKLKKLVLGKTALHANLQHGKLDAQLADVALYNGKGNASITLDATSARPAIQSTITLQQVDLEPLLKDIADSQRFSGAANLQMSLYTSGASEQEMIYALAGKGEGRVDKGTLKGINIGDMVHNLATSFKPSSGQKTEFSNVSGSFLISQGVLSNKDLVLTAPTLNVSGAGEVNLPQQTIHYRLTPQMQRLSQDPAAGPKAGLAVPVVIEGSLDNPTYRPDVGAVLQDALKDPKQFREELKNSRGSLKDQLKDPKQTIKNLKGLLKGL